APAPADSSTLSLSDALPICGGPYGLYACPRCRSRRVPRVLPGALGRILLESGARDGERCRRAIRRLPFAPYRLPRLFRTRRLWRSEEHTSELQSRENLVCRL